MVELERTGDGIMLAVLKLLTLCERAREALVGDIREGSGRCSPVLRRSVGTLFGVEGRSFLVRE